MLGWCGTGQQFSNWHNKTRTNMSTSTTAVIYMLRGASGQQ